MEKRFTILRFVGNAWKVLAWIVLGGGLLASIGVFLASILGGEMLRQFAEAWGFSGAFWASFVGGIVGLIVGGILSLLYFLLLYAVGELIFLLLTIEENTRMMAFANQPRPAPVAYSPPRPTYTPPPPPSPVPTQTPPPPPFSSPSPGA